MIIFESNYKYMKDNFKSLDLFQKLEKQYKEKIGRRPSSGEHTSWIHSIPKLMEALINSNKEFPDDMGVLLEYSIPHTRSRVDVIFTGINNKNQKNAVIVELKQWEHVGVSRIKHMVQTSIGNSNLHKHPSFQAKQYKKDLSDIASDQFNKDNGIKLSSCVYLHNHKRKDQKDIYHDVYNKILKDSPSFSSEDSEELATFIYNNISRAGSKEIMESFKYIKYVPSKRLIARANKKMDEVMEEFKLYGEQNEAFEIIRDNIEQNLENGKNNVFMISGAAGTGKTIVALKLYLYFKFISEDPRTTALMFPGTDFRSTMSKLFNLNKKESKTISGDIIAGPVRKTSLKKDFYDVMIIDEAHKLQTTHSMGDARQYEEVVKKVKNTIFLTDKDQLVSVKSKEGYDYLWNLNRTKYNVINLNLSSQFRISGGNQFIFWINRWLKNVDNGQEYFKNSETFKIRIISDVNDLWKTHANSIKRGEQSRILSTNAFDWTRKIVNKKTFKDVILGDKKFSWYPSKNTLTPKNMIGLDKLSRDERSKIRFDFNLDSEGEKYVGYYNTVQGSEFNHVSIFVGPELFLNNKGEIDLKEELIKGSKGMVYSLKNKTPKEAKEKHAINLEIYKNQLKVLLTRAIMSIDLYVEDEKLREFIKNKIK